MSSSLRTFLSELKRRRVYRVAVVYAFVAFVIWQAAEIALPALNLPDWALSLIVVLTLLGFPVALVLAWAYDLTPAGVRRTEPLAVDTSVAQRRWGAMVTFAAGLFLALAMGWLFLLRDGGPEPERNRVLVLAFENRTGEADLDPLGWMAADWITQGLHQTGLVEAVPSNVVLPSHQGEVAGAEESDRLSALSVETGAEVVVSGAYYRQGEAIRIQAQITDMRRARLLTSVRPVSGPVDDYSKAIEELRGRVMGALATHLDPRFADFVDVAREPPTYDAYKAYMDGVERQRHLEYTEAISHYSRAVELDSTFVLPLIASAAAHHNLGYFADADSLLQLANRHREFLSPLDRASSEHFGALLRGDWAGALYASRQAVEYAPGGAVYEFMLAWSAYLNNRPREAVEVIERIGPERESLRGWYPYWGSFTAALHALGDHRRELEEARRGRRQYPQHQATLLYEVRALAALGRTDEVNGLLDESLTLPPQATYIPGEVMYIAATELWAHRYRDAARQVIDRAIRWYRSRPSEEALSVRDRRGLAWSLVVAERSEEAQALFEDLAAEFPQNLYFQAALGLQAARRGDREEALRVSDWLAGLSLPYLRGSHTYYRARIASLLGDREQAVTLLRESFAQGSFLYGPSLHRDPDLEALHDYPPFQELLRPKG